MDRFHIIPDGDAVLRSKGVFKQAKVYRRGKDVYAAHGAGFIRLIQHGGTTVPNIHWLGIDAEGVSVRAPTGKAPTWSAI